MAEAHVLVVTSSGAPVSAVVPVLAAIEAAGMRARAVDVGGAGGGGSGVTDRMRRALLGEGAERKLRREFDQHPPDVAIVFDPHAAQALTVARDQATHPAPVVAVVGDLAPAAAWSETDADRLMAVDDIAAVALADAGVEADRIVVVGAIGERLFADAGAHERSALRTRFKFGSSSVILVEVAGLGAEATSQLALQLSLIEVAPDSHANAANSSRAAGGAAEPMMFLFDAGSDVDAAAVLRRQVPSLGLKAKLFGTTDDAPLLWRAADVIIARPRPHVIPRVQLIGGKLVALVDDRIEGSDHVASALELRGRAVAARGLLMLSSALATALRAAPPPVMPDGADAIADIVAAVAGDKRAILDERRAAHHAHTHARVKAASAAAQAAAGATAMPGDLEDLSGASATVADQIPDKAELDRLRAEVAARVAEMTKSMVEARAAAARLADQAKAAMARGDADAAALLDRSADAERARMHSILAELATLESELRTLETAQATVGDRAFRAEARPRSNSGPRPSSGFSGKPRPSPSSIEDQLEQLKRANVGTGSGPASSGPVGRGGGDVDDELAALKRKMASSSPAKKR